MLDNIFSTRDVILVFSDWDTFSLLAFKVALKYLEEAPDNTGVTLIGFAIVFIIFNQIYGNLKKA